MSSYFTNDRSVVKHPVYIVEPTFKRL